MAKSLLPNKKLSNTQISKIIQSSGFLGRLLGSLIKTGLSLINNVLKQLAKSVLILVGLTAAANGGIHKISWFRANKNINNFK